MQYKITIPKPCTQDWDAMTPDAAGRYCSSCTKTVTDFSTMTDEAIQQYFIQHHTQPICGRFKNEQLHRVVIDLPHNVFRVHMPFWKKFLVAALIVFSASVFPFETTVAGKKPEVLSNYRSNTSNSNQDKKPRKKKKHRKRWLALSKFDPLIICQTMGFTTTYPAELDPRILYPEDPPIQNTAAISGSEGNSPEKKEPIPAAPLSPEFILPALLLKKRKNLNTAMD